MILPGSYWSPKSNSTHSVLSSPNGAELQVSFDHWSAPSTSFAGPYVPLDEAVTV